ncbi:MAG: DUF2914 domain-containing protein [bacterium]
MRKNTVVGFTVQKTSPHKIFYWLLIIVLAVIAWYLLFGLKQQEPSPVVQPKVTISTTSTTLVKVEKEEVVVAKPLPGGDVEVLKQLFCREVVDYTPQGITNTFSAGQQVNYYTRVLMEPIPGKIQHVWQKPDGSTFAVIDLNVSRQPTDTWSYLVLPPQSRGKWLVKVIAADKVIDKLSFDVE